MADDTPVDAWQLRLEEIKRRIQRPERLSLNELESLRAQQREIKRLIRDVQP